MVRSFITYPFQFFFFVLVQVLVLNNMQFSSMINPYLYIIFLLWLPIETPKWFLLAVAFVLGIAVDMFTNTMGMHASACIFLAFCRPFILGLMAPRDGYEPNQKPGIKDFGIAWFVTYATILTLLHHLFLFYVEVFRFENFFSTLARVFASTLFTLVLIVISQYFRYNAEDRS
ncbi:MAG: rod shape-determining protein MreD [Vicingaceae bacterium]